MEEGNNLILAAIKNNSKLLQTIYEDLAQPGVQKVGIALATIFDVSNTILLPIKLLNEKTKARFEKRMNEYKEKLEDIPDDKINEVPPEIGIPIMDRLTFISEDEISDKFLNLLVSASNKDEIDGIHPSFVQMLDRLTVDEARILEYMHNKSRIPYINIGITSNDNSTFSIFDHHLTGIETDVTLIKPKRIKIYLDNLASMGIVYSNDSIAIDEEHRYPELEKIYTNIKNICENQCQFSPLHWGGKVNIVKGFYQITDFGFSFIWTCMKKSNISKIFKKGYKVKHEIYGKGEIIFSHSDERVAVQFEEKTCFFFKNKNLNELEIIDI